MPDGPGPPRIPARRPRAARRGGRSLPIIGGSAAVVLLGLVVGGLLAHDRNPAAPEMPPRPADVVPVEIAAAAPAVALATASGPVPVLDNKPVPADQAVGLDAPATAKAIVRHVSHEDLMAADRRLRAAYLEASRAGVPRKVLVAYHDRWADLRQDARGRPDRVADGYGRMSADLERIARARGRCARGGPLQGLLDLFS